MYILIKLITIFFNMGVASGFLVGALLLLRPALVRALSPRQRLWLWFLAWGAGYLPVWYNVLTLPRILPVTLLDLITPRTMADESIPAYLPVFQGGGQYNLAFPGGASVTVSLEWWMAALFCLVWAAGVILMFRRFGRQSSRLKETALQGRLLDWDGPELGRLQIPRPEDAPVQVRLCRDLPTSFICSDWESRDGESISTIYLQEELPPERMALVLRHELNHRVRIHGMVKAAVTFALALHWWNPLLWLAHRYVCLDLESAPPGPAPGVRQDPGGAGRGTAAVGRASGLWRERRSGAGQGPSGLAAQKHPVPGSPVGGVCSGTSVLPGRPLEGGPPPGCGVGSGGEFWQHSRLCPAGPAAPARAGDLPGGRNHSRGVAEDRGERHGVPDLPPVRRALGGVHLAAHRRPPLVLCGLELDLRPAGSGSVSILLSRSVERGTR